MTAIYNKMFGVLVLSVTIPATVMAASAPLIDNQVIVDNSPFYSQGAEDRLGTGNYALNHPGLLTFHMRFLIWVRYLRLEVLF